jgi:dCMP deaminase
MNNDKYYINKALEYSLNSNDPSKKVGCCIVKNNKIISKGCNNPPKDFKNMTWNKGEGLDNKHLYIIHAEAEAIISAKCDLTNAILYTTFFPCNECSKLIIISGIKEIVYLDDKYNNEYIIEASKILLDSLNIKYRKVEL